MFGMQCPRARVEARSAACESVAGGLSAIPLNTSHRTTAGGRNQRRGAFQARNRFDRTIETLRTLLSAVGKPPLRKNRRDHERSGERDFFPDGSDVRDSALAGRRAAKQKSRRMAKLALLSVSDKNGLVDFATALVRQHGYTLLSTGGTAKLLAENRLPVTEVSQHTGFPEIMEGRVKTLHPKIHGGLLCRRDKPED